MRCRRQLLITNKHFRQQMNFESVLYSSGKVVSVCSPAVQPKPTSQTNELYSIESNGLRIHSGTNTSSLNTFELNQPYSKHSDHSKITLGGNQYSESVTG